MASITTRETSAGVGDRTGITNANSPLTNAQIDQNFIELNNDKLEVGDATSSNTADTVVKRDSNGSFSMNDLTAGDITATSLTISGGSGLPVSSGGTGATTAAGARNNLGLDTDNNVQFNSLGIGTPASGVQGEIRALKTITSWYSDERLKSNIELIPNALEKVDSLRGVTFNANPLAESFGFDSNQKEVGVIAQDVQKILPEAVKPAPFDRMIFEGSDMSKSGEEYMTVQYERLVPLLVEAIKQLNREVNILKENAKI
jgi:hypothetical protein